MAALGDSDCPDTIFATVLGAAQGWSIYPYVAQVPDSYNVTPVLPSPVYVYYNVNRGDGTVGTLRASNIHSGAGAPGANLTAATLKVSITVDDVAGTYAPTRSSGSS